MKKADPINHYCSKIGKSLNEFQGIKPVGSKNLDTFTKAFIEAFLVDVNENEKQRSKEEREDGIDLHLIDYELRDIDPRSLQKIINDCVKFKKDNIEAIEKGAVVSQPPLRWRDAPDRIDERAGYDFYYTRMGHGVGFWEKGRWEEAYGKELTSAAKEFGSIDGYVGDDNKIYIMGAKGDWTAKGAILGVNVPKEEKPYKDSYGDDDEIDEGGAKLSKDGMVTGHTDDMIGNWTIGAFDTKHSNKKETPEMIEVVGPNETGAHEIGKFYMKADDTLINKFEEYMNKFYELGDKKFQNLALNIVERFLKINFTGPLATGLPIDETEKKRG